MAAVQLHEVRLGAVPGVGRQLLADTGDFICLDDASGPAGKLFDPCDAPNACDKGLSCESAFMVNPCGGGEDDTCCLPFCDVTIQPDPCPELECSGWYLEPPPELADVGVCGVKPI